MSKYFLVFSLLPFFSFGDSFVCPGVYTFPNSSSTNPSSSSISPAYTNDSLAVSLYYANRRHAVTFDLNQNQRSVTTGVSSSRKYLYPFLDVTSGSYVSVDRLPLLSSLETLACQLVLSGFSLPNMNTYSYNSVDVSPSNGSLVYFNINPIYVISSCYGSSNLVYRSLVESSLSDIWATLDGIYDDTQIINGFLGNELSPFLSLASPILQRFDDKLSGFYLNTGIIGGAAEIYQGINGFYTSPITNMINHSLVNNPYLSDFIRSQNVSTWGYDSKRMYDFVNQAQLSLFSDLVKLNQFENSSSSSYVPLSDTIARHSADSSFALSSSYSTPLTNALKKMTTDWKDATTNQLAQNTANITNQLAQWKRDLKGHNDLVTNDLSKIGNSLGDVSGNVKSVADMLSGTSPAKAHVIVDNAVDVNVLNWPSEFHININANDLDAIVSGSSLAAKDILDGVTNRLDNITNSVASLAPFFEAITNLQLLVNSSITNLDLSVSNIVFDSFRALLLDDYADYVTNLYYSSAVDTFKDDYPSVYTNLLKFGLSTRSGEGNFWSLFSSTLLYQSALVCGMLEDLAIVRQFAEDHIEGGFQGGVTSLIEKMPSSTDLADRVNQASNEVLKIEASANSFYSAYSVMTNSGVSAFSPFRGVFSSVPENVLFFKTGNEQYVTIPVSRGGNAWSVIRLCFSFSLVAVNVILFPKFVLMVVVLLSKISKRFVKFVPTD